MIKESLLKRLVGQPLADGEKEVYLAGHKHQSIDNSWIIPLLAQPNTIILWHVNDVIVNASAGDPLEVDFTQ